MKYQILINSILILVIILNNRKDFVKKILKNKVKYELNSFIIIYQKSQPLYKRK